ncbi:MAG: flippase [Candidatus Micrarchaeota archaeon]
MTEKSTIVKGTAWSILSQVITKGASFIYLIILTHYFSQGDIGSFYWVLSILGILTIFTDLGMNNAFSRYLPYYYGERKFKELKILIKSTIGIGVGLSFLVSLMTIVFADQLSSFFGNPGLANILRLMGAYLVLNQMFEICRGILIGRKDIKHAEFGMNIQNISKLVFTLAAFYILGPTIYSLILAFMASLLLSVLYGISRSYGLIKEIVFKDQHENAEDYENLLKEIVPFGLTIAIIGSLFTLAAYVDKIMIGALMPEEIAAPQIAIYTIAIGLAGLVSIFQTSINRIFFPVISEMLGKKDNKHMERTAEISIKWLLMIIVPTVILLLAFGGYFLELFYGSEYRSGETAMSLIAIGLFISAIGALPGAVLIAMKRLDIEFGIGIVAVITNIIVNWMLIPQYGINGAAFALMISLTITAILTINYSRKIANLKLPVDAYKPILAGMTGLALILILKPYLLLLLNGTIATVLGNQDAGTEIVEKMIKLIAFGALFGFACLIYFACLLALRTFGADEIDMFESGLKKAKVPESWRKKIRTMLEAKYLGTY